MHRWLRAGVVAGLGLALGCHQVARDATHPFSPMVALPPAPASGSPYGVMPSANPPRSASSSALALSPAPVNRSQATIGMIVGVGPETPRPPAPIILAHYETVERRPAVTQAPGKETRSIDYSSLEGELYYVHSRSCWRLRYAPAGQADRYGGIVTLVGDGLTPICREGQTVRVEGTLLDPDATEPQPNYWVRRLTVIKQAPVDDQ